MRFGTREIDAADLGLGRDDVEAIAKSVPEMIAIGPKGRQRVMDEANDTVPERILRIAVKVPRDLGGDDQFMRQAGLPWTEEVPEKDRGCISAAVARYVLNHQGRIGRYVFSH